MTRLQRAVPIAAAAVWLAAGAGQLAYQAATAPRAPAWAAVLAPLAEAPLAPGAAVALVPPAGVKRGVEVIALLYEAAWQRPDLRWAILETWPAAQPIDAVVTVNALVPPPGWHEVWRSGLVAVHRKAAP